jgi:hypothetical protein
VPVIETAFLPALPTATQPELEHVTALTAVAALARLVALDHVDPLFVLVSAKD